MRKKTKSINRLIGSLFIMIVFSVCKATADDSDVSKYSIKIEIARKSYKLGEVVPFRIIPSSIPDGIALKDVKFWCHVYADLEGKGYVQAIPSLVTDKIKQEEPMYQLSETKQLEWSYKNKPEWLQPKRGVNYMIMIEIYAPKKISCFAASLSRFNKLQ